MSAKVQEKGSVLGGALLITGSCIGAGMLALPAVTGFAGFVPAMFAFFLAWAFMTSTALLLIEVCSWFHYNQNFSSMTKSLLGNFAASACFIMYLLLFYGILVAYIAESGIHTRSIIASIFSTNVPIWFGSFFFVIVFGWFVYLGTKQVDILNRCLMLVKIIAFILLIGACLYVFDVDKISHIDLKYSFFPLPILVIAFGFHNMIPPISQYMGGDIKRVKLAIIYGSIITLFINLVWLFITLGTIPLNGEVSIVQSYAKGYDAVFALSKLYPKSTLIALSLAFAAILTSFLAQSASVAHFLSDGLKMPYEKNPPLFIVFLTFIPPLVIAQTYPAIFYKALEFSGLIAVLLFGFLPVLMVYKGRYLDRKKSSYQLFGGKIALVVIFLFALFIISNQVLHHVGIEIFPRPS